VSLLWPWVAEVEVDYLEGFVRKLWFDFIKVFVDDFDVREFFLNDLFGKRA